MVETAQLIVESAFLRRESRGGHFRSDFPMEDPSWAIHVAQRIGDEPRIGSFEEILSRTPAPTTRRWRTWR